MTCETLAGAGSEEQKLPTVTLAGMPSWARSLCRVLGSNSTFELMDSVAVPLAFMTSVNAAVWILAGPCGDAEPVRPRPSATPAPAAPATDSAPRDWRVRER